MTITHLAEKTGDGKLWTVEDMLRDAVEEMSSGKRKANRAIVVYLDDAEGDSYNVNFAQAGMNMAEIIALLECAKALALDEMGF